ncbi:hypothetical protein SEUCBS139899_007103, partial [Sporothrix eucalyptigena]
MAPVAGTGSSEGAPLYLSCFSYGFVCGRRLVAGVVVGIKQACGAWSDPSQSSLEYVSRKEAEAQVWSIVDGHWWGLPPYGRHVGAPG